MNETQIRVRYAETDQMGVAYHAQFFVWFEVGRVELLRQLGFSYADMENRDDCLLAVVDARCRFKSPARYDDQLLVRTHLKSLRASVIHFSYEIVRAPESTLLAEGETVHIVTDSTFNRRALPEKYLEALQRALPA